MVGADDWLELLRLLKEGNEQSERIAVALERTADALEYIVDDDDDGGSTDDRADEAPPNGGPGVLGAGAGSEGVPDMFRRAGDTRGGEQALGREHPKEY